MPRGSCKPWVILTQNGDFRLICDRSSTALLAGLPTLAQVNRRVLIHDWAALDRDLSRLLPPGAVVRKRQELLAYDCDGLTIDRHQPVSYTHLRAHET